MCALSTGRARGFNRRKSLPIAFHVGWRDVVVDVLYAPANAADHVLSTADAHAAA
ncbi:hypothetical protein [Ramlibacter sp.]|uniref:hypothetical protein n=1 Tax=Ramlibacter sp. TaxID=1917967 RepID=UPI003D0B9284